jgi:hypothetical protein
VVGEGEQRLGEGVVLVVRIGVRDGEPAGKPGIIEAGRYQCAVTDVVRGAGDGGVA